MNIRKITSMTLLVSLIVLTINSVVLYIVPEGRVAYWADWTLWGLTKSQWGDQHITIGFLFLLAGILHIFYNWAPIKAYMKNKAKELKVFTPSMLIAFVVTLLVVVGTYFNVAPMSTVLNIGSGFKDAGSAKYGEPPYGHAELSSLKMFTKKEGLDLEKSMKLLEKAGLVVGSEKDTIKVIAKQNKMTPKEVYNVIKPAKSEKSPTTGSGVHFPASPKPGLGKKTLESLCEEYGLKFHKIEVALAALGIEATRTQTMKEIGAAAGKEPAEVYEAIYEIVNSGK